MDPERSTASTIGRWVGWVVVLALTVAVAVATTAVVGQVTERPLMRAAAPPSAASPSAPPAAEPVRADYEELPTRSLTGPLPDVAGRSVGEAEAALEQVGAAVLLVDSRNWSRPVGSDWVVCATGQSSRGDGSPTADVTVSAVPAGDPCA
ncbi:hypothetical protein GCU67_07940 [Modestobacter muralis]|uniref:PASTA domain-containing protein n=1 Tax=Modestobacter muralis TaxID=1608614 RepID=A0A6P0H6V1_9ACTN|nr:hypothetical protein [Modestobacter muralis]NEK94106.1 hypothetical protein [Modestobacter muralis]NEN50873.1 hypothetical protein [Modestobacter muralis]